MKNSGTRKKVEILAENIATVFENGLTLKSDSLHYIDSTFLNPSAAELEKMLSTAFNCETETLLELIFFPDEDMQIELEGLLEKFRFEKKDEEKVLKALYSCKPKTILFFPDKEKVLKLGLPKAAASQFISRLNISRRIDPILLDAVETYVTGEHINRFKVRLRNARFAFSQNRVDFLNTFFEKMNDEISLVLPCFDFLLAFFDELKNDGDIYSGLMDKKRFYLKNIQKSIKLDTQLKKNNMETFILQGGRVLYFDKEDARRKIRLIDKTCHAVFGKTENFEYDRI